MGSLVKLYSGQERWDEAERLAISVMDKKKELSGRAIQTQSDPCAIWQRYGMRRKSTKKPLP